jgi:hypothetical protein
MGVRELPPLGTPQQTAGTPSTNRELKSRAWIQRSLLSWLTGGQLKVSIVEGKRLFRAAWIDKIIHASVDMHNRWSRNSGIPTFFGFSQTSMSTW